MRILRRPLMPFMRMAASQRRRQLCDTTFIGITGSVGKSTTTELLSSILAQVGPVSTVSLVNTPFYVLRQVLLTKPSDRFMVAEISGGNVGDIEKSRDVINLDIGVVTVAGLDHYRMFRTREAVAEEKVKLIERLPPNGFAILNGDDPNVRAMGRRTKAQVVLYGEAADCDVRVSDISAGWPQGLSLTVHYRDKSWFVKTKFMDRVWVVSITAAFAAALAAGVPGDVCARSIGQFDAMFGRMSVHTTNDSVHFLLDTAKAPGWTMQYAVDFIVSADAPRKTVVLGKISDTTGGYSQQLRKWIRRFSKGCDRIICVGEEALSVTKLKALEPDEFDDRLFAFLTAREAADFLQQTTEPGELVFVKSGSRNHLERLWLNRSEEVKCWLDPCPVKSPCIRCRWYKRSAPAVPASKIVSLLR